MKDVQFNFYEFGGIIIPGTVVMVGLSALFPEFKSLFMPKAMSAGEFGIFIILAYVAGHLIQVPSRWFEIVFWTPFGGMPTDWVRQNKGNLVRPDRRPVLESYLVTKLGYSETTKISDMNATDWENTRLAISGYVIRNGSGDHLIYFNRIYGFCRGMTTSFLVFLILVVFLIPHPWLVGGFLLVLSILSAFRMHTFAVRYAQELYIQFLANDTGQGGKAQ